MLPDYNIIGKRIKAKRTAAHLTQEQLAEYLNISVAFLSRVERGSTAINLKRLTQIADILGISPAELLTGSNTNSKEYLKLEFSEVLDKCNSKQQKLIYQISEIVSKTEMDET